MVWQIQSRTEQPRHSPDRINRFRAYNCLKGASTAYPTVLLQLALYVFKRRDTDLAATVAVATRPIRHSESLPLTEGLEA